MVGRVRRRENWWAPGVFSLDPPKLNLSKMERKFKIKWESVFWTKLLFPQQPATNNFLFFCFCLFLLLSSLAGLDFFFFPLFFFFFLLLLSVSYILFFGSHLFWILWLVVFQKGKNKIEVSIHNFLIKKCSTFCFIW